MISLKKFLASGLLTGFISVSLLAMKQDDQKEQMPQKLLWLGCKTIAHNVYSIENGTPKKRGEERLVAEIAAIVTDAQFNKIDESESFIVWYPDPILDTMDEQQKKELAESGLLQKIKNAQMPDYWVDVYITKFIDKHFPPPQKPKAYMHSKMSPIIMLRSMRELGKRINIDLFKSPFDDLISLEDPQGKYNPTEQSTAAANALEAIKELQHYRQRYFIKK